MQHDFNFSPSETGCVLPTLRITASWIFWYFRLLNEMDLFSLLTNHCTLNQPIQSTTSHLSSSILKPLAHSLPQSDQIPRFRYQGVFDSSPQPARWQVSRFSDVEKCLRVFELILAIGALTHVTSCNIKQSEIITHFTWFRPGERKNQTMDEGQD